MTRVKTSPKKREPTANWKPQFAVVVNNNDEEGGEKGISTVRQRRGSSAFAERKRELAASLLQRQVQVWLLRRQEARRAQEVQRLRAELRKAAACVVEESYTRHVKRRAIHRYLHEIGKFESRLDVLLQGCIGRKHQLEKVQRFATLRRQQKHLEEARKRKLVHDWLDICLRTRRKEKQQVIANAREKLLGWVRRWTLRRRCEARGAARAKERQDEEHRRSSAQRLIVVYRAYKLCRDAKEVVQRLRRMREGLMKLYSTFRLNELRAAQSCWNARIHDLNTAQEAATKVQRVYRVREARSSYVRVVASCRKLQRVLRGYHARVYCSELRQRKLQEAAEHQRNAAATAIQRYARGHRTRLWLRDVLVKLRERFRCANCGAIEPGGTYCKYCGRHRPSLGPTSSVLMLHGKWQQPTAPTNASEAEFVHANEFSDALVPTVPSTKKTILQRSRSTSLRLVASSSSDSVEPLTSLPAVLSPRHRRLVARNSDPYAQSTTRRNSIASITALRAMAIADLQAKCVHCQQETKPGKLTCAIVGCALNATFSFPNLLRTTKGAADCTNVFSTMGNSPLSREFSGRRLTLEEREAMKRFGDEEIRLLRETFKGLANGKDGISVDKETFLKCFPMRGLLGERLFEVIDKDGSGSIHYNEFVYGLAILFRGSRKEKLKFIFDLYDLSEAASISRHELLTMLHQFPESALELVKPKTEHDEANNCPEMPTPGKVMEEIEALVDLAFPSPCPPSTRLTFEQFCHWCENTPGVTNFLMSVLPVEDQALRDGSFSSHCSSAAPVAPVDGSTLQPGSPSSVEHGELRKKRNSFASLHVNRPAAKANAIPSTDAANRKELEKTRQLLQDAKQACSVESVASKIQVALAEVDRLLSVPTSGTSGTAITVSRCGSFTSSGGSPTPSQALDEMPGAILVEDSCSVSGDLWKRGLRLRKMIKRHYVLQGNFLYYYASPDDTAPRGVTFLSDCYVEVQPAQNEIVEKGVHYYGVDIVPEPGSAREKRTVFTRSQEAQKRWAAALRQATDKISIEEVYNVGAQLGRGRFSKVCEATHKHSGVKSAVKIIDKSKLQPTEKELLRTEIAILKLVHHPNIIRLYDVYEDRQYIFIVTELVSGGELFNRIVGRARYTEAEARLVMHPLLESVNYLHRLGIVHRDLKPENILCGDALTDLKIADFGLSKLVHPEELMKMPCGTLNYVAPEVLALVGYGREADIWSLGVIMYLLLRGELPFYGKAKSEVIQKTLHAEINLETDSAWRSVSPAGKALLRGLLTKDPTRRLTAQDALQHEWFSIRPAITSATTGGGLVSAPPNDRQ
ncbi:hypothetical protein PHYPSEUDO_015542 [Phytophthora pseudosyringae]|uniref:non-specific serine/threonine protein kinase n=1 Tax=Phytophthora pseudosyringae TaxID=221518 RepID=A0A8T1VYH0_9STRA|nr:hypothetical protein PHYPSEUDO_015542 [Phytophthora pseudosyringae]